MTNRPRGFFGRVQSLIRGMLAIWIRDAERQHPRAVYEQAIEERVRQYRELKEAVAGILYMRNKLEAEIGERRLEMARLGEDVRRGIRRGEDEIALGLVARKQALAEEVERAEGELSTLRSEAEEAKSNLLRFRDEIRGLEREKGRTLATLANARARRRLQEALDGLSVDAEMRALEGVRQYVARLASEAVLDRELGGEPLRARLAAIREEARREAARSELEELRRELLPRAASA